MTTATDSPAGVSGRAAPAPAATVLASAAQPRAAQVVRPRSVEDVVALVRRARADRLALYPVSRGMNWGYGGAAPLRPDGLVVDLSAMDRIRNAAHIGDDCPVALVEPGVTQRQLHEHLCAHAPQLRFNVTGSAAGSSLIGNALERGVGYLGPRVDDLYGLEVVLGTGEVLRTGFRRLGDDSPLALVHPHGLGPAPDGLFFQGGFGIVTSGCFRLQGRRPVELALSLALPDATRLGRFIDALALLRRDGLLTTVTHVGNAARAEASLRAGLADYLGRRCGLHGPALERELSAALGLVAGTPWTALGGLSGTRAQVRAALSEIRSRLAGLARVRTFSDTGLATAAALADRLRAVPGVRRAAAALAAVRPLQALALGAPSDVAFDNLLARFGPPGLRAEQYAQSRAGVLFVNPALPLDGRFVQDFVPRMVDTARAHGQTLYLTLNLETDQSLVAVANLLFDRANPAQAAAARAAADALLDLVHRAGLELYRAGHAQMARAVARDPAHFAQLERLRRAWDPDGVIAPGRYSPVDPAP
jgi:4-cresol dehydrogenase (hydroxylating)